MRLDLSTFVFQVVNFLVLVWLLRRFLWKPLQAALERRQATLKQLAEGAEEERRAAQAVRAELEQRLAGAAEERERLLDEARAQASVESEHAVAAARTEAEALLAEARRTVARERGEAAEIIRREAADVAIAVAERILAMAAVKELDAPLVERALQALQGRDDLGGPIRVVAARQLPADLEARLRERLGPETTFEIEPSLLAGVELHFPHTELRFSFRGGLNAARKEIESHGEAA